MIKDVDKLTEQEVEERTTELVVRDTRPNYDAETPVIQEGVPVEPEVLPALPVEEPVAEPTVGPFEEIPKPKPPVMHVPSLLGGTIEFTVGEMFPWRGVFFMVADVKTDPAPHILIVPVDHTSAHKKLAKKFKPGLLR